MFYIGIVFKTFVLYSGIKLDTKMLLEFEQNDHCMLALYIVSGGTGEVCTGGVPL